MIIIYDDFEITISFSSKPMVVMRYTYPEMSKDEIDAITAYPFENKKNIEVNIYDKTKEKSYTFYISKGYTWDGATIPRFLWSIIGSKTQPEFLVPSMIHDILCEKHYIIDNNRKLSTKVFKCLLMTTGVTKWKANLMCFFVDLWQRFLW